MAHLVGIRTATAVGAHISTYRGAYSPAFVYVRRNLATALLRALPPTLPSLDRLGAGMSSGAIWADDWASALAQRVDAPEATVPAAARRAFQLFSEDLASVAPTLRLHARLLTRIGLEVHLESFRVLSEDFERHPEIAETPVEAPVFIVGMPRTGTTLLHHLLSLDPEAQCLRAYELMRPVRPVQSLVPAQLMDFLDWAKLALVCRLAAYIAPQWPHHHSLDAESPEECLFALQRGLPLDTHYRARARLLDAYASEGLAEDAYLRYRQFLQQVQVRRGTTGRHYVLKGQLLHLQYLEALLQAFPDARLVWTHRPPEEVVGSLCSLRRSQQEIFTSCDVDLREVGQGALEYLSDALVGARDALASRGAQGAGPQTLAHVHYDALVKQPIQVVEELYRSWGSEVSPAHREAMESYLAASLESRSRAKKERGLYHKPDLAMYGLSPEAVHRHFEGRGVQGLAEMAGTFAGSRGVVVAAARA